MTGRPATLPFAGGCSSGPGSATGSTWLPRDYRPALQLARHYVKEATKDRIRARGQRVTDFLPREITTMANELLLAEPGPFVARAKETLVRLIAKGEIKGTVNILDRSATSGPQRGEVS
jgi:hypothetical protein